LRAKPWRYRAISAHGGWQEFQAGPGRCAVKVGKFDALDSCVDWELYSAVLLAAHPIVGI
jgi:hypothetical protein